jgi:hypothetical protein
MYLVSNRSIENKDVFLDNIGAKMVNFKLSTKLDIISNLTLLEIMLCKQEN